MLFLDVCLFLLCLYGVVADQRKKAERED